MGLFFTRDRENLDYNINDKIKINDLVIFSEQFSVMINAGIPIAKCLQTLGQQTENPVLKRVLYNIRIDIEGGSTFSGALGKYPKVFSELYINLVKAGESGGILDDVLLNIVEYLNKQEAIKLSVKKSLAYPLIVIGAAALAVTFLVIFIVPVFAKVYESMHINLPLPTIMLLGLSNFFVHFWWLIIILIAGLIFGILAAQRNEAARAIIDTYILRLPFVGRIIRLGLISRFVRILGLLISSGVTMNVSLGILEDIVKNKVMVDALVRMRKSIKAGTSISSSILNEKVFPPTVVEMIAAGEESGKINVMLKKSSDLIERDLDFLIQRVLVSIEPILTFFIAVMVGFIALAIYLPMFDIIATVAKK